MVQESFLRQYWEITLHMLISVYAEISNSVSRQVVGERFGPDTKPSQDMLDAFIRRGLSQKEAEVEVILQM